MYYVIIQKNTAEHELFYVINVVYIINSLLNQNT